MKYYIYYYIYIYIYHRGCSAHRSNVHRGGLPRAPAVRSALRLRLRLLKRSGCGLSQQEEFSCYITE